MILPVKSFYAMCLHQFYPLVSDVHCSRTPSFKEVLVCSDELFFNFSVSLLIHNVQCFMYVSGDNFVYECVCGPRYTPFFRIPGLLYPILTDFLKNEKWNLQIQIISAILHKIRNVLLFYFVKAANLVCVWTTMEFLRIWCWES